MEYASKTYLKDVNEYEIKIYIKNNEYSLVIKKILNIDRPFLLNEMGHDIKLLDNNYYIMEYIPFKEDYFCRLFINDALEIEEYYYQFTSEQGIKDSIPYYKKTNVAYVVTRYGEKIYLSNNDGLNNNVDKDKLKFNIDYKKYLW